MKVVMRVACGLFVGVVAATVIESRVAVAEPFAAGVFRKVDGKIDKMQVTGFVVTFPGGQTRDCVMVARTGDGYHSEGAPAVAVTCDWP